MIKEELKDINIKEKLKEIYNKEESKDINIKEELKDINVNKVKIVDNSNKHNNSSLRLLKEINVNSEQVKDVVTNKLKKQRKRKITSNNR